MRPRHNSCNGQDKLIMSNFRGLRMITTTVVWARYLGVFSHYYTTVLPSHLRLCICVLYTCGVGLERMGLTLRTYGFMVLFGCVMSRSKWRWWEENYVSFSRAHTNTAQKRTPFSRRTSSPTYVCKGQLMLQRVRPLASASLLLPLFRINEF